MANQDSKQKKPHLNVGTIGHVDHGKTTLTAAIMAVQSNKGLATIKTYKDIAKGGIERDANKTVTIQQSHVEYETDHRHFGHTDCPGHADFVKNLITGAAQMDAAILVVSAADGPMPQTREHILLAKQVAVPKIIVYLNKADATDDDELVELVELEVRELLDEYGYDGNDAPVVIGSALLALKGDESELGVPSIAKLMEALDQHVPIPERDEDGTFLFPVERTCLIEGRGTVATGRIYRGSIKVGDSLELVGLKDTVKTTCSNIEMFNTSRKEGVAGENVGLLLRGLKRKEVKRGQVLCTPGTVKAHQKFKCQAYILTKEEGGRHTPFFNGYRAQFYARTTDVAGIMTIPQNMEMVLPGDNVELEISLEKPIAIEKMLRFALREGGITIGSGVVTEILE